MTESATEPGAGSESGRAAQAETLRAFLSAGSVRCPSCGYDVQGCDEARCPECAWELSLQLTPRVSFVPYWVFSLLINGWLFLWGTGGLMTTSLRAWRFHGSMGRRLASASTSAQLQAALQPFAGGANSGGAGSATGPNAAAPNTLVDNCWTYFVAQSLLDQVSTTLFLISFVAGATGLLLTPWMRRLAPRANAWLILVSVIVFVATMCNYIVTYTTYLVRAL